MKQQIEHSFTYHAPTQNQVPKYEMLRKHAKEFAHTINTLVPNGREKSLAITRLEEVVMWANKGIACAVEPQPKLPDLIFTSCGRVIIGIEPDNQFEVIYTVSGNDYNEDDTLVMKSEKGIEICMPVKTILALGKGAFIIMRMSEDDAVSSIGAGKTFSALIDAIMEHRRKGGKSE